MPAELKRKSPSPSATGEASGEPSPKRQHAEASPSADADPSIIAPNNEPSPTATKAETVPRTIASSTTDRLARFKALQARQAASRTSNRTETALESQRSATDPNALTALHRKRDIATHKLLKADATASGEDFERKRAWDWTAEEAEKWDKRVAKKEKHREDVAFQDYRQQARKVYKRQVKGLAPEMEAYEREKGEAVQRAAERGGLEIVETEDGEVIAVDKDGSFYATANSTGFVENRPEKTRVDALVADLKKAEEVRLRNRKQRGRNDDDGDVTYINDKNKQFNQKLARFYNKYTSDIRDSFERGTAI